MTLDDSQTCSRKNSMAAGTPWLIVSFFFCVLKNSDPALIVEDAFSHVIVDASVTAPSESSPPSLENLRRKSTVSVAVLFFSSLLISRIWYMYNVFCPPMSLLLYQVAAGQPSLSLKVCCSPTRSAPPPCLLTVREMAPPWSVWLPVMKV